MSQIDENQASPAITVLLQRVMAAAVDLTLIAIPTTLVAFAASERFPILEVTDGRARFELADQLRINEIDSGLNRATQLGDTVYALSGVGLVLTITTVMMMTLLVFVLMPALQVGQTPGRSILRLPVRADRHGPAQGVAVSIIDTSSQAAVEPAAAADLAAMPLSGRLTEGPSITKPVSAGRKLQPGDRLVVNITNELADPTEEDSLGPETDSIETSGRNPDADQLRALLQASLDQSDAIAQVTLGDDNDYASWVDLNRCDLTDGPDNNRSDPNRFATLTLPESSLSETPLTASTIAGTTVTVEAPVEVANETQAAMAPEWSAELHAWIFHDPESGRLFRHDEGQNRWTPIT